MLRNFIKKRREDLDISQEHLAIKCGLNRSTISDIETDRHLPRIDTALKIAKALQCKVDDIFILD